LLAAVGNTVFSRACRRPFHHHRGRWQRAGWAA